MKTTKSTVSDLPSGSHPNGHPEWDGKEFGCSEQELSELMELDKKQVTSKIQEKYGGVDEICKRLHTMPKKGLSGDVMDLQIRTKVFGSNNSSAVKASESFFSLLWNAAWDITLLVLIVAIVLSYAMTFLPDDAASQAQSDLAESYPGWIEYVALIVIILILVMAFTVIEWQKQRWFCSATSGYVRTSAVIRGGEVIQIPSHDIVVGDIYPVKYGDVIPADGLLIHGNSLKVKERLSNGAIQVTAKDVCMDPVLRSGSHVIEGNGKIVITKVGPCTRFSADPDESSSLQLKRRKCSMIKGMNVHRLQHSLWDEEHHDIPHHNKRKSVLEKRIILLTIRLCYAGIAGALLTFAILVIRLSVKTFLVEKNISTVDYVQDFMSCFLLASAVLFVIVPIRLPAAVSLAFAQTIRRMNADGNVVHNIRALENAGYVTDIITNKTGTLTGNKMSVAQLYFSGNLYKDLLVISPLPPKTISMLVRLVSFNTEYTSQVVQPVKKDDLQRRLGDETDCALLKFVLDLGHSYEAVRELMPEDRFIKVYPFNATRKFMSRVIPLEQGGYQLIAKGASELILHRCNWILDFDGNIKLLSKEEIENIVQVVIQPMSRAGLSTVCLAFKNYVTEVPQLFEEPSDPEPNWEDEENIVSNLTCVAVFGIEDSKRDEVPKAVAKCQRLGIRVRLVSGDGLDAACIAAFKCGIMKSGGHSMTLHGKEFEQRIRLMPRSPVMPDLLKALSSELQVMGRSSPENRYIFMQGLSDSLSGASNHVTACVGKDIRDGPSLKTADVGFSMGTVGSEATREASDIILKHNSFNGIVRTVLLSRCIQDNIRKLLQFHLTETVVILFIVLIGSCFIGISLLDPTQLLWIKMNFDVLMPLALTSESCSEEIFNCKPYQQGESLFSRSVGQTIIGHSIYQMGVIAALFFVGDALFDMEDDSDSATTNEVQPHFTVIFNTYFMMILFNAINSRVLCKQRNIVSAIHQNYVFIGIWIGSFIVQILIIQFGGVVFSTVPLTLEMWGWCILFGVGELLWGQVIISIPSCKTHKDLKHGKQSIQNMEHAIKPQLDLDYDDLVDDSPLGIMLWRHGLTRLQNQLRVARAFQNILEDADGLRSSPGSLSNNFSWPMLDEILIDESSDAQMHNPLLAKSCSSSPLRHMLQENQHLNFKSRSADNVLCNLRTQKDWLMELNPGIYYGSSSASPADNFDDAQKNFHR